MEALAANRDIEKIIISKSLTGEQAGQLRSEIRQKRIPSQYVPHDWFRKLQGRNHQGVACFLSAIEYQPLEQLLPMIYEAGKVPFFLILDRITDVRNFGAIARSAECAGIDAIIVPDRESAMISGDAVRTSAGALNTIPVCRVESLSVAVKFLQESGLSVFGVTEKANKIYTELDYSMPLALVMGSEENGITPEILRCADELVKIPLQGKIGSLNVSVASGILLFEAVRQRQNI